MGPNYQDPFLETNQRAYFPEIRVVKHYPPTAPDSELKEKLRRASVIIIGETHGSRLGLISALITDIALGHEGTLALLVEGEAAHQQYLHKDLLNQKKDKITILCWDTSSEKEVLHMFFSQIIEPINLGLSQSLQDYLKDPSPKNLSAMGILVINLQKKLVNLYETTSISKSFPDFEKSLEELDMLKKRILNFIEQLSTTTELSFLKVIFSYYQTLGHLADRLALLSTKARNETMVEGILEEIKTHEKVIVVAGRLHLSVEESPDMKGKHEVEEGLRALKRLKDPFNSAEYVILEAPLPEDILPLTAPLPDHLRDDSKKESKEELKQLNEKSKQSLEPLEAKRLDFKGGIKQIRKADWDSLSKIFSKLFSAIWKDMKERGVTTNRDAVAFFELNTTTLGRLMDLKEESPSNQGECIAS
ncbi:MAG: hypothetical protein ACSNEK_09560 [Parachlamydiaceae bacterium]